MDELAPDPRLVELRRALEHARTQGVAFDSAWEPALAHALDGLARWERQVYAGALTGTAGAWEAAYTGATTKVDRALAELESYAVDGELDAMSPELAA